MKKITFEFTVSTRYVGSEVKDEIELEFEDDATEEEIEKEVTEVWVDWRNEQCDGGWSQK
jgi:hypothetical protein